MRSHIVIFSVVILALLFTVPAYCIGQAPDIKVRVAIIEGRSFVNLSLTGRYVISSIGSRTHIKDGSFLKGVVASKGGMITLAGMSLGVSGIKVSVARDSNIYVDSRRFRGDIDIMAKGDKILVVNNIGLDKYLYGVLYHEVSHRWPTECLKAQAIVARTFALEQMRQNKTEPYDLRCDIYSQVYGGRNGEKWSTSHAVDATRGKVLTFNGDIFPTYYHATCSGYTEDASNLWKVDLLPLKGVPCKFCGRSKHYRWRKEFSLQQVREKLNGGGYTIGPISTVEILTRNRSGRNDRIKISDTAGGSVVITGKDFRQLFGPNEVRSTKFDAEIKKGFLVLNGMGWGHGVGMCQWGAFGMAERGKKCDEILKYYYPGTEITTINKLPKQ
jgi:stage II sporulation protein D